MTEKTVTTIDHGAIRAWASTRGGKPAVIEGVIDGDRSPVLQIAFDGAAEGRREISWAEFFRLFDEGRLALIHGGDSDPGRTCKLVGRVEAEDEAGS